jgi:hypothetical protein
MRGATTTSVNKLSPSSIIMVATRTQLKRCALSSVNPLEDPHILKNVMSYVGPGHWLFLSTVSKAWLELYLTLESVKVCRMGMFHEYQVLTCVPHHTTCAAVFASASRVKLAHSYGLQLSKSSKYSPLQTVLQTQAGKCADKETLLAAHDLGLPWSASVLCGAAESGSLPKLQWLMDQQNDLAPRSITNCAAKSGNLEMLVWLRHRGAVYDQAECAVAAAEGGRLQLLQELYITNDAYRRYSRDLTRAVVQTRNLAMVRWLCEQGDQYWNSNVAVECAASNGDIATMKYCVEQGALFISKNTMMCAVESGNLDLCQYLHAQQCPLT